MGKKSLTKSTTGTKKNTAAQKKGTKKKSDDTKAEKNNKTKSTGTKKAGTKKTESKKTTKKPALKTLRKKKFETWVPENPYVPAPGTSAENAFTAPEITGDYDQKDAEKIRTLLFKKIDLTASEPEAPGIRQAENAGQTEPEKPGPRAVEEKGEKSEAPQEPAKEESREEEGTEEPAQDQPPGGKGTSGGGGGQPPQPPGPGDGGGIELPVSKGMLGLICALALIFVLIIGASIKNIDNYYLEEKKNSLEIWRGDFSPSGREKVVKLPGVEASKPLKDQYSKQEALTLAFKYFMDRADDVTDEHEVPDLETIRQSLEKAKKYATTEDQKEKVTRRLNRIEFLRLLYRADVAAENRSEQGYEKALDFLEQADDLKLSKHDRQALKQRTDQIRGNLEKLQEESGNKGDSK
ncbi:MAG: hypothetical protein ACLFML_01835 [Desulfobacterales bacterium]